ncbi:siderophore ABC transporter substrate-binding protein [Vibrio europaeus]|uniref:siderophore ABC transporter substrate-binding protein n=1 Tax=Vibrio europaeus TaxID=300876 RepID=UPI0018A79D05|nr:siderophore ABC transporter substrate-binding protein [Vibrio europaeus]MDC5812502.1 siderophore ABC transporter substrate-binding protein [Vibrio europaeus]MDC5818222.1 siderophore ABC transporter substrate-binding protein [Vibrio europaeus]MDC5839579.1 siderophore ABC transporter substrate-binding protein [Vibrio europaeus]MDC5857336.1 siderophore ABC transporter substrate-binding protein [Vibrio europaeus]MDC5871778.1 siderophore ABC transporter substrate-binding protein [Vibrio europaeu
MKLSVLALATGLLAFGANAKMVEIEHAQGTTKLESNPERVVVIGLGALDTVKAFGIEPVAVSTVSMFPDYLAEYRDYKFISAGSLHEPDFETIYTQKPDLIIVGSRGAAKYKELTEIAPTIVFAADSNKGYWESTQEQWRNLGEVFEKQDFVESKIEQLDKEFKSISVSNDKNDVDALTVMSAGGNITAFGAQSRFSAIYKDFGFKETVKGIKESRHGDLVSYEFIREKNPSTLLVIDKDILINKGKGSTVKRDFENDLVKATDAYQNKKLAYLDINAWYLSIAGMRATEQMIEDVKSTSAVN